MLPRQMKKDFFREGGAYDSPEISIVEIKSEGVLCQSGSFEQWNEEDFKWE